MLLRERQVVLVPPPASTDQIGAPGVRSLPAAYGRRLRSLMKGDAADKSAPPSRGGSSHQGAGDKGQGDEVERIRKRFRSDGARRWRGAAAQCAEADSSRTPWSVGHPQICSKPGKAEPVTTPRDGSSHLQIWPPAGAATSPTSRRRPGRCGAHPRTGLLPQRTRLMRSESSKKAQAFSVSS